MEKSLVHIGAQKETVLEARKGIMEILNADAEQATKVKALETLIALCESKNNAFTNCNFATK